MTRGTRESALPGLRRGLPLIFLGTVLVGGGLYFWLADRAAFLGSYPLWLYCLPVGAVALLGGFATSFFPEAPEPLRAGTPVADGFVAIPAADWLAVQRLLRPTVARAGGGAPSTPAAAGTAGVPSKDMMATSFAFAPALANESSANRRKRAGLPVRREEMGAVEAAESATSPSTASTGP